MAFSIKQSFFQLLGNRCFLCGLDQYSFLCENCQDALPKLTSHCPSCALPTASKTLCGECLQSEPSFSKTVCAFEYQFPLPFLVNHYKHHRHLRCGTHLVEQLAHKIKREYEKEEMPDIISPVPMHWQRRLRRGFNQSAFLSQYLAKTLKLPHHEIFGKTLRTHSQQSLSRKQRLVNLGNTFALKAKAPKLAGKHIAIVDDVITTGATAETLSKILVGAGVERVDIWAIARTPKK